MTVDIRGSDRRTDGERQAVLEKELEHIRQALDDLKAMLTKQTDVSNAKVDKLKEDMTDLSIRLSAVEATVKDHEKGKQWLIKIVAGAIILALLGLIMKGNLPH